MAIYKIGLADDETIGSSFELGGGYYALAILNWTGTVTLEMQVPSGDWIATDVVIDAAKGTGVWAFLAPALAQYRLVAAAAGATIWVYSARSLL